MVRGCCVSLSLCCHRLPGWFVVFFLVLTHAYPTEHHGKADVTLFGRCALTPRTVGVQQIFYHALSFARMVCLCTSPSPLLAPPPAGGGPVAGCVSRAKNITDLTQYRKTHFSLANQGFHGKLSLSADDNASCDNNTWHGNTFGTANQGCIQ